MVYHDIEYDWFGFKMVVTGKERKNAKQREYRENNLEHILATNKEYRENNKEQISAKNKIYREAHREQKSHIVTRWRKRCVIPPDGYTLCELYEEIYLPCNNCMVCNKDISMGVNKKCMDHCHDTGHYRQVLCAACNNHDSWEKHSEWV
jgi:hypothetical protein